MFCCFSSEARRSSDLTSAVGNCELQFVPCITMSKKKNHMRSKPYLTFVVCLSIVVTSATQTTCPEGTFLHYFDDKGYCAECPSGTFRPRDSDTSTKCFQCTKIEDPAIEVLISPCDKTQDANIQCVKGYFRRVARNPREKGSCINCTKKCLNSYHQAHECKNFTDLACCPGENYDIYTEGGVSLCRERPWICGKGQYADRPTVLNDCKPCPENTFMPEDYHSHTKCWDCHYKSEADLPLHTVITQNCTSTQPARYRCKDGYYMNYSMSYRGDDVGCSPCHSCDEGMYEVRRCDGYRDTVCCHEPDMTEMDVAPRRQCIDKIDELLLYPSVGSLPVRMGGCQSVMCYTALLKKKAKPDLTWFGPNVDESQQFKFEDENYQNGVIVYKNTLTLCNFSSVDEGMYQCRNNLRTLNDEKQIFIGLACQKGTYNPPDCDKTCSQHCLVSEESDGSPCHHNNGTCLFGCHEGYTGPWCEASQDEGDIQPLFTSLVGGNGTDGFLISTIVLIIILVLLLLVWTFCLLYTKRCPGTGPQWWQSLVTATIPQITKADAKDVEQSKPLIKEQSSASQGGRNGRPKLRQSCPDLHRSLSLSEVLSDTPKIPRWVHSGQNPKSKRKP